MLLQLSSVAFRKKQKNKTKHTWPFLWLFRTEYWTKPLNDYRIGQFYPIISIHFNSPRHSAQKELTVSPPAMSLFITSCSTSLHPQVTLQYLWEKEYQVLVFYHHPMALEVPFLWPGQMMPSPWANTTDPEKLVQFLQASVTDRRSAFAVIPLLALCLLNTNGWLGHNLCDSSCHSHMMMFLLHQLFADVSSPVFYVFFSIALESLTMMSQMYVFYLLRF